MRIVQRLCPAADLGKLAYYTFVKTEVAGIADAIVSATGYTGAGGCEIYVANEDAPRLWEALWQAGSGCRFSTTTGTPSRCTTGSTVDESAYVDM